MPSESAIYDIYTGKRTMRFTETAEKLVVSPSKLLRVKMDGQRKISIIISLAKRAIFDGEEVRSRILTT